MDISVGSVTNIRYDDTLRVVGVADVDEEHGKYYLKLGLIPNK